MLLEKEQMSVLQGVFHGTDIMEEVTELQKDLKAASEQVAERRHRQDEDARKGRGKGKAGKSSGSTPGKVGSPCPAPKPSKRSSEVKPVAETVDASSVQSKSPPNSTLRKQMKWHTRWCGEWTNTTNGAKEYPTKSFGHGTGLTDSEACEIVLVMLWTMHMTQGGDPPPFSLSVE